MLKRIISYVIRFVPRPLLQIISPWVLPVLALFYRGNRVACPICQSQFRQFLPYGRGASARPNALCPKCLALERHRLIWLYLQQQTDFFTRPQSLLHIAPEPCFITYLSRQQGLQYITADLESPLAQVKMDIHQMPFEDNQFDVVFCNHVLEHVTDDIQAMREINRVLKPNGWAILQVPFIQPDLATTFEDTTLTDPAERFRLFGQEDHVRMYGQDYPQRIAQAGLLAEANRFVFSLPPETLQRYALPATEIIYIGRKKS